MEAKASKKKKIPGKNMSRDGGSSQLFKPQPPGLVTWYCITGGWLPCFRFRLRQTYHTLPSV